MKKKKQKTNLTAIIVIVFIVSVIGLITYANISFNKYKTAEIYNNGNKVGEIIKTDAALFKKIKESNKVSMILIGRPTCSACTAFYPTVEEVAAEYKLDIYYTDTSAWSKNDVNKLLMPTLKNFKGTPTILIMYKRKEVATIVGVHTKEEFIKFLSDYHMIRE